MRWDDDNAWCLCSACHVYFTHFPLEFEQFNIDRMGEAELYALKHRAMAATGPPDYEEVLTRLRLST